MAEVYGRQRDTNIADWTGLRALRRQRSVDDWPRRNSRHHISSPRFLRNIRGSKTGAGRSGTMPAMHRLARYMFTLCSAVSLLLCVATAALSVRSHYRHDLKISKHGRVQRSLVSALGSLRYLRIACPYTVRPEHEDYGWYARPIHAGDTISKSYGSRSGQVEIMGSHWIEGDWRRGLRNRWRTAHAISSDCRALLADRCYVSYAASVLVARTNSLSLSGPDESLPQMPRQPRAVPGVRKVGACRDIRSVVSTIDAVTQGLGRGELSKRH
jgi:hypothetical protein